jgi:hypothetical protein
VNENANIFTRVSSSQPHPKVEISLGLGTSCLFAGGMHYLMHAHNAIWMTELAIVANIHMVCCSLFTTTTGGYFAIQISSQTTKKDVSEIPLLQTIIPRKFQSFCNTITFAPVQSQVLRNSRTWYNRKTFPITTASIHCLRLTLHRKLFVANRSPQRLSEPTQNSIGFRYKI